MKGNILFVLVICLASFACAQEEDAFLKTFPYADVEAYYQLTNEVLEAERSYFEPNFTVAACPTVPVPPEATNVNNLRPGNIKVVMAMGDSITAGSSAKDTSILSIKQYRGIAYSIGGDAGVTTMPNILKPYVPAGYPIGFSTGTGDRTSSGTGLNAAVSGAINKDMLSQAQWLVTKLKATTSINFQKDWKLLTIWIGSNNLCDVCSNAAANDAADFEKQVTAALEYLYANVPRLFVNLVTNLDITQLYEVKDGACALLHSIACGCVGSSSATERNKVLQANIQYQAKAPIIAKNFASRNNPEFTVVVQPFLLNSRATDRSYLSAADCFHPSAISHVAASIALWNNMVTPAAQKKTSWNFGEQPICITADTLLYTN